MKNWDPIEMYAAWALASMLTVGVIVTASMALCARL